MRKAAGGGTILTYGGPFVLFMLAGWYGLAQVVQSKRDLRNATRGLDIVDELDPLERMRRRYGLEGAGAQPGAGSGEDPIASVRARRMARMGAGTGGSSEGLPAIPSMEEELARIQASVDIHNFDYVPVPRTEDEDA